MADRKRCIVQIFNSSIVSGPETLVLPALKNIDAEVTVIFLNEVRKGELGRRPIDYSRSLGLTTIAINVESRVDRAAIGQLAKALTELDPDVVHSHDVKASTYLLSAAKRLPGRRFKLISTHHGVRGRSGPRAKLYEAFYTRFILPKYDAVLAVCTSDRALLVDRGLDPKKVHVHLNGVDRKLVTAESRPLECARLRSVWKLTGVDSDTSVLGLAGRLAPEKRFDRALEIGAELRRHSPALKWKLVIFGSGPLEADLHSLTRKLGLEEFVMWMGYRSGLGEEMAGFDVLCSMSDAEGLPINLIEAGWAMTPIFATAVDGNLDLVPDAKYGLLFGVKESTVEVADRLARLLADRERREKIGRDFQTRVVTEFSGEVWRHRLLEIYQGVVSIARF